MNLIIFNLYLVIMIIVFGTGFYGRIATFKDQWIETKFWGIMFIPIIPLKSFYVTVSDFGKRQCIEIDINTKSVVATYLRLISSLITIFFGALFFSKLAFDYIFLVAIISLLLSLYLFFAFGEVKKSDITLRKKFGSITGLYALPHWLEHSYLHLKLELFTAKYNQLYPSENWKNDLIYDNPVDLEKMKLLYAISLFNYMVTNTPEGDELYAKADKLYQIPLDTEND